MKRFLLAAGLGLAGYASAQNPDLVIRIDGRMQLLTQGQGPNFIRFYDNLGHHSVASVKAFLEIGFQAFISEKFERIPNDPDRDQLDEYYLEDEGIWRLGKQYLPFGSGRFLHETALAARGDTQLILEALPISLAICDNGRDRQRGIVGRIGSRLGLSFAVGRHFGINGTSLCLVRRPEDSPGAGRGYRQVFGLDYARRAGLFELGTEIVTLREGHTFVDRDTTLFDISATLVAEHNRHITLGYTRDTGARSNFFRASATLYVNHFLILEPIARYRDGTFFDAGITAHFKF